MHICIWIFLLCLNYLTGLSGILKNVKSRLLRISLRVHDMDMNIHDEWDKRDVHATLASANWLSEYARKVLARKCFKRVYILVKMWYNITIRRIRSSSLQVLGLLLKFWVRGLEARAGHSCWEPSKFLEVIRCQKCKTKSWSSCFIKWKTTLRLFKSE